MAGGPFDLNEEILPDDASLFTEGMDPSDVGPDDTGEMDHDDFETIIGSGVGAAVNYIDTYLSPQRELAQRYYDGEPFGNEVEGRSAVVATEVRDAVLAQMPGLMRIFAGSTDPVEFEANPGTPEEQAEQQTQMVNHVIMRDNPGFQIVWDAIKDALVKKTGIFAWWWEEREEVSASSYTDLTDAAFTLLQMEATDKSDADVGLSYEVEIQSQTPDNTQPTGTMVPDALSAEQPDDAALTGVAPPMLTDCIVRRRIKRRRVRIAALPPEEFIVVPSTSGDLDRFRLVGWRREMTVGELVALGHDEDEIREAIGGSGGSSGDGLSDNPEAIQRNEGANLDKLFDPGFEKMDPSSEYVLYIVAYVLVDFDGDGIAERRKVCTVGSAYKVIYNEIHDDDMVPFGTICPDPEAHSPFGNSTADQTMDLQEIKSELLRGTLDSLGEAITSRTAVNKNNVNLDDVLNPERGAVVRVNGAPSENIQELSKTFVGANVMPVLAYVDEMKTRRTGTNPASPSGLDADALQSTAKEGVGAMVDASHERLEMIARIFAETGFSRLFKGVRNLLCRHQDFRRNLRLMGVPATVDPRTWVADLDVKVNAGKGQGPKKLQGLMGIQAAQKEIIMTYGPGNPIVTMKEYSACAADIVREMGFSNPSRYFIAYTPEMQAAAEKQANDAAAQPKPEQLLYQAQTAKTAADLQAKLAALAEKRESSIRADATKHAQINATFGVAAAKLLGDYSAMVEQQAVQLRGEHTESAHRLADDMNSDVAASRDAEQADKEREANAADVTGTKGDGAA